VCETPATVTCHGLAAGIPVSSNVTSGKAPAPTPVPENGRAARSQQGSGTFELGSMGEMTRAHEGGP
jgi:hypothetical protein